MLKYFAHRKATRRLAVFRRDRKGVISIEVAILVSVLSLMAVGTVDLALAFARQSEMSNAVRAGVQFALVRRPSIGPSANEQDSIMSLETIRTAVIDSARYLTSDPGADALTADVFCQCPDTTPVVCVSEPGVPLPCSGKQTFLEVTLLNNYTPVLRFPGIPESFQLQAKQSIRLN